MTANGNLPLPRLNMSARGSWADDLSITKGRHSLKAGVYLEFNHKTEPGSADYVGNYNFGNDANNPLNTGNGYANMLLGAFSTYTELTARVDKAVRHWQNDFYAQDNWRVTPRLTLDYGVRVQHSGSDYEVNDNHTGFFTDQWNNAIRRRACTSSSARPASLAIRRARRAISERSTRRIRACSSRRPSTGTSFRTQATSSTASPPTASRAPSRAPTSPSRISWLRRESGWRGTSPVTERPPSVRRPGFSTTSRVRPALVATRSPAVARSPAATSFGGRRSTTSPRLQAGRAPCSSSRRLSTSTSATSSSRLPSRTTSTSRSSATSASTP